ncbi:MAG: hypothetical protein ACI9XC_002759 [Gammaproteobacteria bacterium]|jgi:hypothetical protein
MIFNRLCTVTLTTLISGLLMLPLSSNAWEPPNQVSLKEIQENTANVMAMPVIPTTIKEDIFRIQAVGMDWDIGVMVYQPTDQSRIPVGADGKKLGIFLLHGGTGDWRSLDQAARIASEKFGYRVVSMTFPGRLNLDDDSRDWPLDTVNPDGTYRTPIWLKGETITPDQYEVITDGDGKSGAPSSYGTNFFLSAKEGTVLYNRMAGWPVAFEEGMKTALARHFPVDQYSVYAHGHSTGGPFIHYLSQRVNNLKGIVGYGTALFGYMNAAAGSSWNYPFHYLRLRTWRDAARYADEGFVGKEMSLPVKMERVFEGWDRAKVQANFKAEDFVHKNSVQSLSEGAKVTAQRMKLDGEETQTLVDRYVGYTRELKGSRVKPVPPILHINGIGDNTVTYGRFVNYGKKIYDTMVPPPKANAILFGAGVHSWGFKDEEIPYGIAPAVIHMWNEAIQEGYFD